MRRLSQLLERNAFKGPGFDRIRLIAALTVVAHHCSAYVTSDIAHDLLYDASGGLLNFGQLAVYVFFVTSGALVVPGLLKSRDVVSFAIHRALRIVPALFVIVILTAFCVGPLLSVMTTKSYFSDADTYIYLNNIVFRAVPFLPGVLTQGGSPIVVNGALWTIYFEVLSYACLAVMFLVGALQNRKAFLILYIAIYISNIIISMSSNFDGILMQRLLTFLSLFVYFSSGLLLILFADRLIYNIYIFFISLLTILSSFFFGFAFAIFPVCLAYIVIYLGYSSVFGKSPLRADLSYGIYLTHSVVITVLMVAAPAIKSILIVIPIVLITSLALAFLSWHLIEAPSLRRKKSVVEALWRKVDKWRSGAEKTAIMKLISAGCKPAQPMSSRKCSQRTGEETGLPLPPDGLPNGAPGVDLKV